MRQFKNTLPSNQELWKPLLESKFDSYSRILSAGFIIEEYQNSQDEKYAQAMCYEVGFEGLRALVVNKPLSNSKVLDSVFDPEKHDIRILFGVKAGLYKYSLFSDKPDIDVSEIAKKYDGGGHKGAAGFYSKNLLV